MNASPNETIVITGASSGIGRELARQIAAPGRCIWLVARDKNRLQEVAESVRANGAEARVVALDLGDLDTAGQFLHAELALDRPIDQLYLAAAVSLFGEVKDICEEDWDLLYRTDLLSYLQWIQAVYPQMVARRSGTIVLVSSLAGYVGYPTSVPYASMKAGLLGLFKSLRYEADQYDVHIHLVAPGYVDTGIYEAATYRGTNFECTMKIIEDMHFKMIPAERAAAAILDGVRKGKYEICFPGYARMMVWLGSRLPVLIGLLHRNMITRFRGLSR